MIFPLTHRKLIRGFQAHIDVGLKGACDYVADVGTPVFSPFYGEIYHFQDEQGGNWIGIKRDDGLRFEFAHLSSYIALEGSKCVPGQEIALSGNTGTLTSGPHVHHQIIDKDGNRIDPEFFYFAYNVPVLGINGNIALMTEVQNKILEYSQGMLTISWDLPALPTPADPNQDQAYQAVEDFLTHNPVAYLPNRFFIFFCNGTNAFDRTYYYPKRNCTISVIPANGADPRSVAFEFSHQIQQFFNENRGNLPGVEIVDSNFPSDDLIISKYRSVLPNVEILNKII